MQLEPGSLIQKRYRIEKLLAQGGMGAVYQARDERLGHLVALKQTLMSDPSLRAAFEREARLLAALNHAALPVVSDHFVEQDGQFLVMQFIPGDDLAGLLKTHGAPFAVGQVLAWGDQLLDALEYLHGRTPPVIHRDIKPQNLKLNERNELIVLDFGLAKGHTSETGGPGQSLFGYTPKYAPLEQIQGSGTTAQSDLYAVGATLYELLTGTPPADALTRAAALVRGGPDPLQPAQTLRPELPLALSDLLTQVLAINPASRLGSAAAMRVALRQSVNAAPPALNPQLGPEVEGPTKGLPPQAGAGGPPPPRAGGTNPPFGPVMDGPTKVLRPQAGPSSPPPPPAAEPSPSPQNGGRRRLLLGIGLGCASSLLLVVLSCAFLLTLPTPPPASRTATAEARTATAQARTEGGSDPTLGLSRAAPLPVNSVVSLAAWDVTVLEQVRGEAAYEALRKANSNNGPPAEGNEYLLLRVQARSTAPVAQDSFERGDLRVIGVRHTAYALSPRVPPEPAFPPDGPIAPGEVIEGWAAYEIGREERDLLLAVGNLISNEARFVALTAGANFPLDRGLLDVRPNEQGMRWDEPAALGELVITDDWEVTVHEVIRGEAAWERIYANNRFVKPPPPDFEYAMIRATVRRLADDDRQMLLTSTHFIGTSADQAVDQPAVVVPDPHLYALLFPGGSVEGWAVVTVRADDPDARLVFRRNTVVSDLAEFNTRFFVLNE